MNKTCLKKKLKALKKRGKRIVFTNGCFDILHAGHIRYLKKAKKYGDVLIVAVNSDSSVRKIKGRGRPVFKQRERVEILEALGFVDYVVLFNELTPAKIIKYLKPNILIKGADYRIRDIVGSDFVRKNGGVVKTIPLVKGKSTSGIIRKIKKI